MARLTRLCPRLLPLLTLSFGAVNALQPHEPLAALGLTVSYFRRTLVRSCHARATILLRVGNLD